MYVVVCLSLGIHQQAENTEITNGSHYKLNGIKVSHAIMVTER